MFPTFFRFFTDASFFQANVGLVAGIIICALFIIGLGLAEAEAQS